MPGTNSSLVNNHSFTAIMVAKATMVAKAEFGSPATVHSRLKSMGEKGWLMLADAG